MLLSSLLSALPGATLVGPREANVTAVAYDSRRVRAGDLFVALPGLRVDGHRFIDAAIARGATAVLCQQAPSGEPSVPHIVVADTRAAIADAAAALYGYPAERLTLVGVTGTDGKTTTGYLVHAMLHGAGHPAGLIGTVAFKIGATTRANRLHQTTPEAPDVQHLLAEMVAAGLEYAVVETSSHALVLDRLRGCRFSAGILTNITSDHLDFHGDLESYRAAKARLFAGLGPSPQGRPAVAILNRDDPSYAYLLTQSAAPALTYGLQPGADVQADAVEVTSNGIRLHAVTPAGETMLHSPLTGRFNVYNLLAALACGVSQGLTPGDAAEALAAVCGVPGRMQRVEAGQPFDVVVDFAHTPDALAKVLDELRAVTPGRLIVVFGAPGERDRTKRPVMGRAAAERADLVILANDDPRSEESLAIIEEIAVGARAAGLRDGDALRLCPDRRAAIRIAVEAARPGDTVLLAGKGHEDSITIGTETMAWNEEAEARAAIALLGAVR